MDSLFGLFFGIAILVFACYAASGLHNYLSNKHKQKE